MQFSSPRINCWWATGAPHFSRRQIDELRTHLDTFARKWRGEAAAAGDSILSTYQDIKTKLDHVAEVHRTGAEHVGGKLEELLIGGKRKWGDMVQT